MNLPWFKMQTLSLIALMLSASISYAQYCAQTDDGKIVVQTENLAASPELQAEYLSVAQEYKKIGQSIAQLKEQTLTATRANTKSKNSLSATPFKTQLDTLKLKTLNLIAKIPSAYRSSAQALIEAYFQIAERLMLIEILENPSSASMSFYKNQYTLNLSVESYENIYPLGLELTKGLEVNVLSTSKNKPQYILSLSGENVFRALVRGAAQSDLTTKNNTAYLETVRCSLNRLLIGKIKINQALLGISSEKLNISNDQMVCLGTKAQDFINLAQSDVEIRKEKSLREKISDNFPKMFVNMSAQSIELLAMTHLGEYIAQLRIFPELLGHVNSNRPSTEPEITPTQLSLISSEINSNIEAEYKRVASLQSLRNLWAEPKMSALFNQILSNCQYRLADSLGQSVSIESLIVKLAEAEDFYFFNNLSNDLESIHPRLSQMNSQELKLVMKSFIISRKLASTVQALITVLNYFSTKASPDLDALVSNVYPTLLPLTEQLIESRWAKSDLDKYVLALIDLNLQKRGDASSMNSLLLAFTTEMIEAAKQIKNYLSENTKAESLPLDKNALIRSFRPSLSNLATDNLSRAYILIEETDFSTQKQIWESIQNKLNSDVKKFGVECKPIGLTTNIKNYARGFFENDKTTAARESAQRDCDVMQIFSTALGLNRETPTKEFSVILDSLYRLMSKDDYATFIKTYREELTFDLFGEYRLLEMEVESGRTINVRIGTTAPAFKPLYQVLAEVQNPESVLPLIKTSVAKSLTPLKNHLSQVINAKQEKDLDFFIKRTKVINAILGENDLSALTSAMNGYNALAADVSDIMSTKGFVFPNLIQHHAKLQESMINNEEINDEVFEEFLSANVYISMGVLGGWMAKHALGVLPRWLGGPSLASLIHKVGNNTINLIDGQGTFLMGLIGAHVGSLEIKKSDIRTQLRHINDLTQSETLKPEGAENPLPLIEYSDYKQQYRYYTEGIKGAKLNQVIDFGWLAFPFVMNKAVQQGLKRMATSLENKDAKFEVLSLNERRLYEWRANYSLNHRKKLLQYAFKDLKNPEKSLDLSDLHVGLNKALALAKNPMERAAIKESYENIILEFGPRLEKVIDHPALLDSYSRAMFGPEGTSAQAIQFYEEFRLIALRKMGAA